MTMADELVAICASARALADTAQDEEVIARLHRSVIRPLTVVAAAAEGGAVEDLVELARRATRLRLEAGAPPALLEAVAALQDLAVRTSEDGAALTVELAGLQSALPPSIHTRHDGPYLLTNVAVRDWLGRDIPATPQLALCRCGESAIKPLCDGSHAEVGFTDVKDPDRVPDRRDTDSGEQVTIFDNRGTCAHSGLCSSRLPSVFRVDTDPFVAPSGGRLDEIIRAVRACPSGALGYAIGRREAREQVDQDRAPVVEVSKDGPYRVTGGIGLVDDTGVAVARNVGASLEHYSLCRCGHSQNKPFCSGMHFHVGFADPPMPERPTLFEWAGGFPVLLRTTRLFYEKYVPADPLLAPVLANMAPDHPERVAAWFGGPKRHTEQYGGYDRMIAQHLGKALTEQQRARWVQLMIRSADEAGLPRDPEFRAAFTSYLEWGSRIAVENSTLGARPPRHLPVPRWDWVLGATPGTRVSALRIEPDEEEPTAALPAPGEQIRFAEHVKPLFRRIDRQSMSFTFDLWDYTDVSRHADAILQRLEAGSMPCDGAWPPERIAVFRNWIATGKPE